MVDWAVRSRGQVILDPSCGAGVFLECVARRLLALGSRSLQASRSVIGIDLDPEAARLTGDALRTIFKVPQVNVRNGSFFSMEPPGPDSGNGLMVDAVVGNPPYIRYQEFSGTSRDEALRRAHGAGVLLNRLTSSWAPFVAHAISFIKPGGRLALILPAELIHASYAAPLRKHLRDTFAMVHLVSFRRAVFPDVEEEVIVVLAEGKGVGRPGILGLVEAEDGGDLAKIDGLLAREEIFAPGVEPLKWVPGFTDCPGLRVLDQMAAAGFLVPLERLGKASIGFVSGANDFFVLTQEEVSDWRLPERSLQPALIRARQIQGRVVTSADLQAMKVRNERCLLWKPDRELTKEERAYARFGESTGVPLRYKCRVRSPWHVVPGVIVPEAFLTYMSDAIPRLCLNQARVVAANSLLTVRLTGLPRRLDVPFSVAFYNSATLLSCERIGRSYGGGVLKLEPREADRIQVPSRELLERSCEPLASLTKLVDGALKEGSGEPMREAIARVDDVILNEGAGISIREIVDLSRSRMNLLGRRRARARPSRSRIGIAASS